MSQSYNAKMISFNERKLGLHGHESQLPIYLSTEFNTLKKGLFIKFIIYLLTLSFYNHSIKKKLN
jgi:hypothetical protein